MADGGGCADFVLCVISPNDWLYPIGGYVYVRVVQPASVELPRGVTLAGIHFAEVLRINEDDLAEGFVCGDLVVVEGWDSINAAFRLGEGKDAETYGVVAVRQIVGKLNGEAYKVSR